MPKKYSLFPPEKESNPVFKKTNLTNIIRGAVINSVIQSITLK